MVANIEFILLFTQFNAKKIPVKSLFIPILNKHPMEDSLNKRISYICEIENLTKKQFSELTGIPEGTLNSAHDRESIHTLPVLKKIHHAFPQYRLEWLLFGEGDLRKNIYEIKTTENLFTDKIISYNKERPNKLILHQLEDSRINLFSLQKLEELKGAINKQIFEIEANIPHIYYQDALPEDAAILITNNEMAPEIPANSYLHVRKIEKLNHPLPYGRTYLLEFSGKWQIRKIYAGNKPTHYRLESCNSEISPSHIAIQKIKSVWQIIDIIL